MERREDQRYNNNPYDHNSANRRDEEKGFQAGLNMGRKDAYSRKRPAPNSAGFFHNESYREGFRHGYDEGYGSDSRSRRR